MMLAMSDVEQASTDVTPERGKELIGAGAEITLR